MKKTVSLLLSTALVVALWLPLTHTAYAAESESGGNIDVTDLRTEYTSNPLGLDVTQPRLSWKLQSGERGQVQTAYRIQVASSEEKLSNNNPDMWDPGKIPSDQSVNLVYGGKPLESGKRYFWRVQVWDKSGTRPSDWSNPAWWEMGLLNKSDWNAEWIGSNEAGTLTFEGLKWVWYPEGNPAQGAPAEARYFRKTFDLPADRKVSQAQFLLTADDEFVLYVNGKRMAASPKVADSWKEAMVVDVAGALAPGANTFAIQTVNNGGPAGLIGNLRVAFDNGESLLVKLDNGLRTAKTAPAGWEQSSFNDGNWVAAAAIASYGGSPWGRNVSITSSAPYIRKGFTVEKKIAKARLYASALGLYEPYVNGKRVGKDLFAPGWTDYNKHIQYQTYEITDLLQNGDNVVGALLGDGWYSGHVGLIGTHVYGDKPYLLMQLKIDYTDGSSEWVGSDTSWKWASGPIDSSDILMGETYDAQHELPGWNAPGYDEKNWQPVVKLNKALTGTLVAEAGPTVQSIQEIKPLRMTEPEPGKYVFDLGQNMVGKARLKVKGEAGRTVTLRHAEVLNPDGTFYTANLRSAKATDHYTLKGQGDEVYEPHFTFHGFRYVEVTGYPGVPAMDAVTGVVIHTAAPFSGKFETSSPMLNQLQSNITWGQRGNFLSIPTDTPARDERLGWTGDINVFVGTATFNMDVAGFLGTKWLRDMRDGQSADGAYPDVAPNVLGGKGNAGWGDAGVTVPYTMWQRYGDTRVIEDNYDQMTRWIEYMKNNSTGYIRPASSYGDWLDVNDPTPGDLISTAYFAYSTKLVATMARAIGRNDDADRYEQLFGQVKEAFNRAYVSEDGRIKGNSQTGYVLALYMDLVPESKRQSAADHLVEMIQKRDWHLSTGFLGTRDLLPVLSETGHLDVAYRLLNNDTYPSWGYQIKNGSTTMWERWDSIKPDGSFQDVGMNSFNHYAYGAVGDWMYRNIAGIQHDPDQPGFKHIIIKARPGGNLTSAQGSYESVYGTVASEWKQDGKIFVQNVSVPVNTTATVYIPAGNAWEVTEGNRFAQTARGVQFVAMQDGYAVFNVGSGSYQFKADPSLGKLGTALDDTVEFRKQVTDLSNKGQLTQDQTKRLLDRGEELAARIGASMAAYLGRSDKEDRSGDDNRSANDDGSGNDDNSSGDDGSGNGSNDLINQIHKALGVTIELHKWIQQQGAGQLSADIAMDLSNRVTAIAKNLSDVSAEKLGLKLSLTPSSDTVLPGDTFAVDATMTNSGTTNITDAGFALQAPERWLVIPSGPVTAGVVKPGSTFSAAFNVTVPADQALTEKISLTGSVTYKKSGGAAEVPLEASVSVASPISIASLRAETETIEPGQAARIHATIKNIGHFPMQGLVKLAAPAQWGTAVQTQEYSLEIGEEKSVTFEVPSPVDTTLMTAEFLATASYNGQDGDKKSTAVNLRFQNPPSEFVDHVDVGEQVSEQDHNMKMSPASGANVEAGLTRRYTQFGAANGYFEYDMKVEQGKPFIIRAIETYDRAQIKDYHVYVNGVKVHSRVNETTDGGIVTYQFIVDDPSLSKDGIVTVRFQEDEEGRNYDPSIADVWTMPHH